MTSPLGRAAPESRSQLVVANTAPESRKASSGAPPVAATTTSGFSASACSAPARTLKRNLTPSRSHSATRQSMTPRISRRRFSAAVNSTWPPAFAAASNTTTSCPRSAATRADDHHSFLRSARPLDEVRDRLLASGRGVVDTDSLAGIDRVDAIAHADAGADLRLAAGGDFVGNMRVGEMGAGHADHVEFAALDRVAGGGDVLDAGGVKGRHARLGEVEMRRRAFAHAGDD